MVSLDLRQRKYISKNETPTIVKVNNFMIGTEKQLSKNLQSPIPREIHKRGSS